MVVNDDATNFVENGSSAYAPANANLSLPDGRSVSLPVIKDVHGNLFVNVEKLRAETGACVFDRGLGSTAACRSSVTYVDGEAGRLWHRGHSIESLVGDDGGDEVAVAWTLLRGGSPTARERADFARALAAHAPVDEELLKHVRALARRENAHPMSVLCSATAALSALHPHRFGVDDPESSAVRLIAKMPTLAAAAHRARIGRPYVPPDAADGYAANLLRTMLGRPPDAAAERAMRAFLVLHADHGQNASTTAVRVVGSSRADPYACVAAGVASLSGPAHGGANEDVVRTLEEIGTVDRIPLFLRRARDPNDPFRLPGFGHRVYKRADPRARVLRRECALLLERRGTNDPALGVASALERAASKDAHFVARGLYPNVDFYSGILLRAIGVPTDTFTVLFAVARTVGWVSQWKESVTAEAGKGGVPRIVRPRQVYVGAPPRSRL